MATPTLENVAKLYAATFKRSPDTSGLLYWLNDSHLSLEEIAQSFFDQTETKALYPDGTTTSNFIKSIYNNLFNRAPDADGLSYWITQLESGNIAKHHFILAVINGAQNTSAGQDATILGNKMEIALEFATVGLNDTTFAKSLMANISASITSVNSSHVTLDNYLNEHHLFPITQSWLSGKTLYNIFAKDADNVVNDIATFSFNNDGTGSASGAKGTYTFSYSVDVFHIVTLHNNSTGETSYIKSVQEVSDSSIVKVVSGNNYKEVLYATNGTEYFLTDAEAVDTFVDTQTTSGASKLITFLPDELISLASLFTLDTYDGVLSVASLRAATISATNNTDYYAAFSPSMYAGSSDGVFSSAELGTNLLGNVAATTENIESLFYGTLIHTLKAIDSTEFVQIANFVDTNLDNLLSGDATAQASYAALLLDVTQDISSFSFLSDTQIATFAVDSATSFIELIGSGDITSLIEGALIEGVLTGLQG